jgi:peptide/nickel transport system permease protein
MEESMIGFFTRRLLWGILIIFLFVSLMFFLIKIIVPQDFVTQFTLLLSPSEREAMREELGLNLPLWKQYLLWLEQFFTGGLGRSFYGYEVFEMIKITLPLTVLVFFIGAGLAFMIGIRLGKFIAWRGPGFLTSTTTLTGIAFYTAFPPLLAWLLTLIFAKRLNLFRSVVGTRVWSNLDGAMWEETTLTAQSVSWYIVLSFMAALMLVYFVGYLIHRSTQRKIPFLISAGLFLLLTFAIWQIFGFRANAIDMLNRAALPIIAFTLLSFGETMLIMRTTMTDTLKEEYVKFARAKGIPDSSVRDKHAARNAIMPVVSRVVISIPFLLTGVVIIEDALGFPGIGTLLWDSLYQQDMPVVMVILLLVGLLAVFARIALDIFYAYIDPRIRFSASEAGEYGE